MHLKLIFLLGLISLSFSQDLTKIVEVGDLGKILGLQLWTSQTIRPFYTFNGIPYAKDTSGEGRFKPSEVRDGDLTGNPDTAYQALDPLIGCPQGGLFYAMRNQSEINLVNMLRAEKWTFGQGFESTEKGADERVGDGSEDCLVINVHTPEIPETEEDMETMKKPVIFFIHGGSSTSGWAGIFLPFKFLEEDVLLVSINYRLGVLGALNLGTDDAPGNAAMYDCITGLHWVQRYIKYFGGDSEKVTIYGHSAGGMMVGHLMMSPLANGLFTGVIGSSGSSLAAWGTAVRDSLPEHLRICEYAGCYAPDPDNEPDMAEIVECMRLADVSTLRSALGRYSGEEQNEGRLGFDTKVPSVQIPANLPNTEIFLSDMPYEILRDQKQNNVSVIMGANRHDGSFAYEDIHLKYILRHGLDQNVTFMRNELIPQLLATLRAVDPAGALAHSVANTYFGDAIKRGNYGEMMPGLIDLTSVFAFKAPAYEIIEKHSKMNKNSYYYSFEHLGFWSSYDMGATSDIPGGVPHIDDILYVFQAFPMFGIDRELARRMVIYFTNFAKTGNPNLPNPLPVTFEAFDPMTHPYLKFAAEDSAERQCRDSWVDNALEIF